jgi:hypothetical protein
MDLPDWLSFDFPSLDGLNMTALGFAVFFVLIELYFMFEDPLGVGWNKMGLMFFILFPLLSLPLFYFVVARMEE